jgi:hypothetical protein
MPYMNMPETVPVKIPVLATNAAMANEMRIDGVCQIVAGVSEMGYDSLMQSFLPEDWVENHVGKGSYSSADLQKYSDWSENLSVTVTRQPQHGKMEIVPSMNRIHPSYIPNENYIGKDRVEVEIHGKDFDGRTIGKKVIFFINVVPGEEFRGLIDNYKSSLQKYCGTDKPEWRISEVDRPVIDLESAMPHRGCVPPHSPA